MRAAAPSQFRILIIGAGLSGLTLAHGLHKIGLKAEIFEKDESPTARDQGYRIHLDGASVAALRDCLPGKLFDLFHRLSEPLGSGFSFFDERLRLVAFLPRKGDDGDARAISRFTLRQLLFTGLENQVQFGKKLEQCSIDNGVAHARFADGSSTTGNFLVAADGSSSAVVRNLLPQAVARDTGYTALIGKVRSGRGAESLFPPGPFDHVGLIVGPGKLLTFLSQQVPAELNRALIEGQPSLADLIDPAVDFGVWSLVVKNRVLPWLKDHQPSGDEVVAAAKQLATHSPFAIRRLIATTDGDDAGVAILWNSPVLKRWKSDPAWTMLGDSIHSMVPLRGRGASAAIIDARALCETLRKRLESPAQARSIMADYVTRMRLRNAPQVVSSRSLLSIARRTGLARTMFFGGLRIGAAIGRRNQASSFASSTTTP